jgi:CRISPR-associated protein Cmr2
LKLIFCGKEHLGDPGTSEILTSVRFLVTFLHLTFSMTSLLKFQIGPVQDFIAQARSTRDLWSGSYLLSWLVSRGIKELKKHNVTIIFPATESQPLLKDPVDPAQPGILIPNLPNIFIAEVAGNADVIAKKVKDAIFSEWKAIANSVWDYQKKKDVGISDDLKNRFEAQVDRHLSIAWMATPIKNNDYRESYRSNGWHLDAVRQTRDFRAWLIDDGCHEKDSLSGKEEAIFQGSGKLDKGNQLSMLLHKHTDRIGAVGLIKRLWHLTYLKPQGLPVSSEKFKIRSIPAIAARAKELDDEEIAAEKFAGDKYIAAIAFDGDSIGKWVNGDNSPDNIDLRQHHRDFSKSLSHFAIDRVSEIVEPNDNILGQLIYAGGDDVVCLVPAEKALEVAKQLRLAFCASTDNTNSNKDKPDASAGIAIAHIHAPLQDLIREAQKAEKRAKNIVGRPAFSVTLLKRSGEITQWGSKWSDGGIELYQEIATLMDEKKLSGKFPHRVCQLLTPYLTQTSGLSSQKDAIDVPATAIELIIKEFVFAIDRQGSKGIADHLLATLRTYLEKINKPDTQTLLTSVIGLCTAVAFAHRTKS